MIVKACVLYRWPIIHLNKDTCSYFVCKFKVLNTRCIHVFMYVCVCVCVCVCVFVCVCVCGGGGGGGV